MKKIILASGSPRRKELLKLICDDFIVKVSDVDESKITAETPEKLTIMLAKAKCLAVAQTEKTNLVIGADTVVELKGAVLGKPKTRENALEMITELSGKTHAVHTGVYIKYGEAEEFFSVTTKVEFAEITQTEAEIYINTDDPYDKAGGYGIQSGAAKFIKSINGCYYNVMGFPIQKIYTALKQLGAV